MAIIKYVPTAVPTDPAGTRSWLNDETRRISTSLRQLDEQFVSLTGDDWLDLTDGGASTLHTHSYTDLDDLPTLVTDHGALTGLSDDDHPQYPLAGGTETISGAWTFSGTRLTQSASNPGFLQQDTSAGTNEKNWILEGSGGNLYLQAYADNFATAATALFISRTGTTIDQIQLTAANTLLTSTGGSAFTVNGTAAGGPYMTFARSGSSFGYIGNGSQMGASFTADALAFDSAGNPLEFGSGGTKRMSISTAGLTKIHQDLWITGAAQRSLYLEDTSATSGERVWRWIASGGDLFLQGRTDADAGAFTALTFTRAGSALTQIVLDAGSARHQMGNLGTGSVYEHNFVGSTDRTYFFYGSNEDIYLRGGQSDSHIYIGDNSTGTVAISSSSGTIGFFGSSITSTKPTVSGSRGGNAALASLCTSLAALGLITNSTS